MTSPATADAPAGLPAGSPRTATGRDDRPAGVARTNAGRSLGLLVAVVVLVLAIVLSLVVGSKPVPLGTVWDALTGYDGSGDHVIIRDLRLPRTIVGLLVGAALGVAGGLIQAMTRNPLADPGILGVNAGAAFAVVLAVAFLGFTDIQSFIWFAFAGAVVATVAVYAIGSQGHGGATPVRLTLAGVALGAVLGGISQGITLLDPAAFDRMRFWGAGSLAGRTMEMAGTIAPFVVVGLVIALVVARPLNTIALGDDLASSLGAHVGRTRILVGIAVMLLCGAATAAAGPIAFVGLMVPHVARWTVGPDQRWILPYSAVLAPVLLLVSDVVGRVVVMPGELQVGIVTAFVGAPVLIALVRRSKASGL
ncbi:iron chelate uptake ABC transporter family permease subunit [Cellulosimicrobium sp. NPDC055967]|uniref:iron chelate uptake ABC transporter family permease subunit n=1 Tax=Cellulosimicrobium sp. NPDC055967 TaxID=3345670 RepID=UPI0035E18F97